MRRLLLSAIAVTVAAGCNNRLQLTTTSFAMPVGLAVAGTAVPHLFIANADEDTLQIVTIPDNIQETNFLRGPNLYFPLRIPAGSRPTRLAASEDLRYVIVLDSATSSLTLIDADAYTQAFDLAGNAVTLPLTQRGATPTDMVRSTQPCPDEVAGEACLARVFISLAANGVVLVVDLKTSIDSGGNVTAGPFFVPARAYDVGGEPQRLALSWDGRFLYATDNSAPEVVRVSLLAGAAGIERRDIGGVGGPLAVSRDDDVLLVGRPLSRDVVVMQGAADSSWTVFDADTAYTPQPRCLTDCVSRMNVNDETQACVNPLASDVDICVDSGNGAIRLSGEPPYTAIYVDGAPALITTLGATGGHAELVYSCSSLDRDLDNDGEVSDEEDQRDTAISVSYGEYALVVTEGDRAIGDVFWMPLKVSAGAPLTPRIASAGCDRPDLGLDVELVQTGARVEDFAPYQIGNFMADCVDTPDRARFTCARDASGGGLVVISGNVPLLASQGSGPLQRQGRWDFTWESVIPGLDRSNGGGELHAIEVLDPSSGLPVLDGEGNVVLDEGLGFTDVGLHTEDFQRVVDGDILEILSTPTSTPECLASIQEDRRICKFERRIVGKAMASADGQDRAILRLDRRIEPTCFLGQGRVAYRIRAGDQFLVSRQGAPVWRLALPDRFGPGGDVAPNESIIFELREDLLTNPGTSIDACDRYDEEGKVIEGNGQNPLLARDVRFAVIVTDGFRPYLSGRATSSNGATLGSAGSIPADILVYQPPPDDEGANNPKVYITYSGADTLIGMDPTNADNTSRGFPETQFILRN